MKTKYTPQRHKYKSHYRHRNGDKSYYETGYPGLNKSKDVRFCFSS